MLIRRARRHDVDRLMSLFMPLQTEGSLRYRSRRELLGSMQDFWLICDRENNQLLACGALHHHGRRNWGVLAGIATHPQYRGRGLAGKLVARLELEARRERLKNLFVRTRSSTSLWFMRHGFHSVHPREKLPEGIFRIKPGRKILRKPLN